MIWILFLWYAYAEGILALLVPWSSSSVSVDSSSVSTVTLSPYSPPLPSYPLASPSVPPLASL